MILSSIDQKTNLDWCWKTGDTSPLTVNNPPLHVLHMHLIAFIDFNSYNFDRNVKGSKVKYMISLNVETTKNENICFYKIDKWITSVIKILIG